MLTSAVFPLTTEGGGIMFSGRPSVRPLSVRLSVRCPLTPISRNAMSLYLLEGFQ